MFSFQTWPTARRSMSVLVGAVIVLGIAGGASVALAADPINQGVPITVVVPDATPTSVPSTPDDEPTDDPTNPNPGGGPSSSEPSDTGSPNSQPPTTSDNSDTTGDSGDPGAPGEPGNPGGSGGSGGNNPGGSGGSVNLGGQGNAPKPNAMPNTGVAR